MVWTPVQPSIKCRNSLSISLGASIQKRLNLTSSWSSRRARTSSSTCSYTSIRRGWGRSSSTSGCTRKSMFRVSTSTTSKQIDTTWTFSSLSRRCRPSRRRMSSHWRQVSICLISSAVSWRIKSPTRSYSKYSRACIRWRSRTRSLPMT